MMLLRLACLTLPMALAGAGLTACSGAQDEASGGNTVRVLGTSPSMNTALPIAMVTLDTAEDQNLDLTYTAPTSTGSVLISGVLANEADMAVLAIPTAIQAIDKGAPIQIIAGTASSATMFVVSKEIAAEHANESVDDRLRALKGLTIGTTTPGSSNNAILRAELRRVGLDPDKDVEIIGTSEPTALVSGVKQGRFDAAIYGAGALEQNVADGDADIYIRADELPSLEGIIGVGVIARTDYIKKNPEKIERFRAALTAAADRIADDPVAVGDEVREKYFAQTSPEAWKITWDLGMSAVNADAMFTQHGLDQNLKLLKESGLDADVSFDTAVAAVARK